MSKTEKLVWDGVEVGEGTALHYVGVGAYSAREPQLMQVTVKRASAKQVALADYPNYSGVMGRRLLTTHEIMQYFALTTEGALRLFAARMAHELGILEQQADNKRARLAWAQSQLSVAEIKQKHRAPEKRDEPS